MTEKRLSMVRNRLDRFLSDTRLLLLVYNLWTLFVRFIVPQKHTEAKRGRRWFLLIAARLVE